jgi:hypothetical protein
MYDIFYNTKNGLSISVLRDVGELLYLGVYFDERSEILPKRKE